MMNAIYLTCYVASRLRIPERATYLLLTVALVAAITTFALATGNEAEASSHTHSQESAELHGFESFTEANGSIDPYAPYYGEGDMIDQTVLPFDQIPLNGEASGACIPPVYCW
ncbi:MAG: hypothetical protein OXN86_03895 [Chloroflexota bacterium]|nr:hypothetical protein [Chloroflexota bacterium]